MVYLCTYRAAHNEMAATQCHARSVDVVGRKAKRVFPGVVEKAFSRAHGNENTKSKSTYATLSRSPV